MILFWFGFWYDSESESGIQMAPDFTLKHLKVLLVGNCCVLTVLEMDALLTFNRSV